MAFLAPILGGAASGIFGSLLPKLFEQKQSSGSFLTKPEQVKEFERFDPQQRELLEFLSNALTGKGDVPQKGLLGELFSPQGFEAYAAPARREFEESTVPKLAERFSGLGAGAQKSSAFQQQLAKAGGDLSRDLGEMRSRQQQGLLGSFLGQVMQPKYDRIYQPQAPSGAANLLGGLAGGLSQSLPLLFQMLSQRGR